VTKNDDDDRGAGLEAAPRSSVSPAADGTFLSSSPTAALSAPAGAPQVSRATGPAPDPAVPDPSDDTHGRTKKRTKKSLPLWQEVLVLLVTAFVLALVVKTFFLQAFYIPSSSMEPTLQVDDKILVQKVSYWAGDVQRGDIVVFDDPGGWLARGQGSVPRNAVQRGLEIVGLYPSGGHLVKRVIGVGGDRVRCCNADNQVVVNGVPLEEAFLPEETVNQGRYNVTVPSGSLWVLGDNRANSEDSHAHTGGPGDGFVSVDEVVGRVWGVVWPAARAQLLGRPEAYDAGALGEGR